MKVAKILILVFFIVFSYAFANDNASSESLSLENLDSKNAGYLLMFIQGLISEIYEKDKLDTIAEVVNTLQKDADTINVTLVGTQNVYNADGTIKEIRTIELSIPQLKKKSLNLNLQQRNKSKDSFDANDYDKIREVRDTIQTVSYLGIDLEVFYQKQDKFENIENQIYISKNLMTTKYEGLDLRYVNQTINVDTVAQVKSDFEKRHVHKGPIPVGYLVFDVDGKFIKQESTVVPSQLAGISSDYKEPSGEIVNTALESLTYAFLESEDRGDVPEAIRKKMVEAYPDISFIVVNDEPYGAYWNKDYSVQLSYSFLDLDDSYEYTVYGYNNTRDE